MQLLLSCLLLASLCALTSWSTAVVIQTPEGDVSIMEGETVRISCCWTEIFQKLTVNWLKNQTKIKSERFTGQSCGSGPMKTTNCSYLTFENITRNVSGRYSCKLSVEIPQLTEYEGNGTSITVREVRNNTNGNKSDGQDVTNSTSSSQAHVIIPLVILALLLLITLACFSILRRRQALAARVIYEAPHFDSEMDKHSTGSSRGSSQWCQVPVYESFDYFERVQPKENK